MSELRPYQQTALDRFIATGYPERMVFAHVQGAGKTRLAIEAAKLINAKRILIVTRALVRPTWVRQFQTWWPEADVGIIRMSRARTAHIGKKAEAEKTHGYAAAIKVVSYQLLKEVERQPWDLIVFDESQRLRNPISAQTRLAREFMVYNPGARGLMLTGSLIPNECRQMWAQLDILEPGILGSAQKTGKEPWKFLDRYCHRSKNDLGHILHYGFQVERREELLSKISHIVDEVGPEQVAPFLPPLFVEPLFLDETPDLRDLVTDWAEDLQVTHFGVFTHLNETREKLVAHLTTEGFEVFEVTAAQNAVKRDSVLSACASSPKGCIVSTTHALEVGVSLSFLKAALVVEWTSAVDEVTQFIGRFARQDSLDKTLPTHVKFVVLPEDEHKATVLARRIEERNALLKAGRAELLANQVAAAREYSDIELQAMAMEALASYTDAKDAFAGDDDD